MQETKSRLLSLEERQTTFKEVDLGYNKEEALLEASRCLNCKNPRCVTKCPVNINIPKFIHELKEGDIDKANDTLLLSTSLASICGRVCPQESQCESACIKGIKGDAVKIGRLERYVSDHATKKVITPVKNGHKVAIVGAGPAGLSCSYDLAKAGYEVTIFEALHEAGGVLTYGIPEFRLPKTLVKKEVEKLLDLGVELKTDVVIGKTLTIDEIFEMGYENIFIGSGAGLPRFMNIPGENLNGVYSANEFLTRNNLMKAYQEDSLTPIYHAKNVTVVGGGNVAMDAARTALRLGAKVNLVYRRSMAELPARREEVNHAIEEGINFLTLNNPVRVIGDENFRVKQLELIKMELGEPDESGRASFKEIPGSNYIIDCDTLIMAIGTSPNPILSKATPSLIVSRRGTIEVDDNLETSIKGIYAGGDAVTGAATVIEAMRQGRLAAKNIMKAHNN